MAAAWFPCRRHAEMVKHVYYITSLPNECRLLVSSSDSAASVRSSHQSLNDSTSAPWKQGSALTAQGLRRDVTANDHNATSHRNSTNQNAVNARTGEPQPITQQMTSQRTNQNTARTSTRLVCLYDFNAQAHDDLTVTRGEWLYADLNDQDDADWLWVFSPSQSMAGYIPRTYAKPPDFNFMQNVR